jgi:hypothetical protein
MKTKREIFEAHYRRYQRAGKKDKGNIIDEAAGTAGLNRNCLARVPASYGKKQAGQAARREARLAPGKRGGKPPKYYPAFTAFLVRIREDHGRPRGKLLSPLIRGIIDFLAAPKTPDCGISEESKALPAASG